MVKGYKCVWKSPYTSVTFPWGGGIHKIDVYIKYTCVNEVENHIQYVSRKEYIQIP